MPTKPIDNIIPRDIPSDLKNVLNKFSDFLDEITNFSSHVFKWSVDNIKKGDEYVPVIQAYRHILDMADAISVLIRESCAEPCKMLLRGIFESLLTIEYILEEDTENRGKDFVIWNRHHRLRILCRYDPDDNVYKEYIANIKKDNILSGSKSVTVPDIKDKIERHCRIFRHPAYEESEKEYQRIKNQTKRYPRWWFNMHNGPSNIQALALYLGRPAQYEVLYRPLSEFSHGMAIIEGKIEIEEPGKVAISQIRLPTDAQFIVQMTASFMLTTIRMFLSTFAKNKLIELAKWYKEEIRDRYLELAAGEIIEVL